LHLTDVEASMTLNLVQHRGEPTIWDGQATGFACDTERWVAGAAASALLAYGFKRRSSAGFLLALAGAGLAWWAATAADTRTVRRARLRATLPRREGTDPIGATSEESFPASDAPSWPTTGTTGPSSANPLLSPA
jgi:hypothetical protein